MNVRDVRSDLKLALSLTDLADGMSLDAFNARSFGHSVKSDGTPSIPIEASIEEGIRLVLTRDRPNDGFLGEESGQSGDPSTCWILDPIDGTTVFIAGERTWELRSRSELMVIAPSESQVHLPWVAAGGAWSATAPG